MKTTFEEQHEQISGIAYKNLQIKKNIISYFANKGNATIADLSKEINLSVPKVTTLISTLISEGIVQDFGKINSTGGRRPNTYGLIPDSGFFMGVDIKHDHLNIGLIDLQKEPIKIRKKLPYKLSNDKQSLEALCTLIQHFIQESGIPKKKILGMGLNLSGRINFATGYSYSFFHFHEDPLSTILAQELGIKTFLENDSRAMAFGEFSMGTVREEKNVLFINLDYGIGMGVMINNELYYGKSGFAGELGHIPLLNNELICHCGKKGCLETEASGRALLRLFKDRVRNGSSTILEFDDADQIQMQDIIRAANQDDVLSIELLAKIGETLGRGIAMLINIFNPELVILGGGLAETGEYIRLPIKSAIHKFSLSLVNNDTQLKMSSLGGDAGIMGACLLVRKRLLEDTL